MTVTSDATISHHALGRYMDRRDTTPEAAEAGVRRLLAKVEGKQVPLTINEHGPSRKVRSGEFVLVLSADYTTVVTLWRGGAQSQRARKIQRRSGAARGSSGQRRATGPGRHR